LKASWVYDLSIQSMSAAQGLVMTCGMLGALWIAASQVINDSKSIGQFSTFLVYWSQLQGIF
jgi:ABC-type bacteriocin/lantibiotic exporter with double-glycine peptidase domain